MAIQYEKNNLGFAHRLKNTYFAVTSTQVQFRTILIHLFFQIIAMKEQMYAFTKADQYHTARVTRFLWWLSTAEYQLIKNAQIDRNRYAIIGMTVLGTWVFATLAWTYFFYTSTQSWFSSIPLV